MIIRLRKDNVLTVAAVRQALEASLGQTRFTARVGCPVVRPGRRSAGQFSVHVVRLKRAKDNCGQHPGPCLLNRPHRVSRFLEGADWVAFNDFINDTLDRLAVSADVWTINREAVRGGRFYLRRGRCRRMEYDCAPFSPMSPQVGWEPLSAEFEDWIGRSAPRSWYPAGTPGIPVLTIAEERVWLLKHGEAVLA